MWAYDNVRARPSIWWGGGQSPLPPSEVKALHAPSPTYIIYCHAWPHHVTPHSPNGARMCTTSSGGGGVWRIPPPMPSAVTPRYDTPAFHVRPSINPD